MPNAIIEKHPLAELLFTDFDFADELPNDSALSSELSSVTAFDSAGVEKHSIIGDVKRDAMILSAILKAGVNGEDYLVNFKAVGQTTAIKILKQLELRVRNKVTGSL